MGMLQERPTWRACGEPFPNATAAAPAINEEFTRSPLPGRLPLPPPPRPKLGRLSRVPPPPKPPGCRSGVPPPNSPGCRSGVPPLNPLGGRSGVPPRGGRGKGCKRRAPGPQAVPSEGGVVTTAGSRPVAPPAPSGSVSRRRAARSAVVRPSASRTQYVLQAPVAFRISSGSSSTRTPCWGRSRLCASNLAMSSAFVLQPPCDWEPRRVRSTAPISELAAARS
mmetsp:Transcript_57483/g.148360  ORF Transcript_57483/g.148360 Transcript_57483/m.148360 type:complete len:223 (+) Transcript_57483:180-848(+)